MKPRVVFDTNIYIRKLLSPGGGGDKLFALFLSKRVELYTSKGQIRELIEAALEVKASRDKKGKPSFELEALDALVALLLHRADLVPTQRQNKVSPDADDDFIIGIAIKAKAAYLVTENSQDIYQEIMPRTPPITILSVRQALELWKTKNTGS